MALLRLDTISLAWSPFFVSPFPAQEMVDGMAGF